MRPLRFVLAAVLALGTAQAFLVLPTPRTGLSTTTTSTGAAAAPRMMATTQRPKSSSLMDSLFKPATAAVGRGGSRSKESPGATLVRRYFELWNERRMAEAVALFSEDCVYEDTLYPGSFEGHDTLRAHLFKVADALPDSFAFVVDEIADGGETIGVQWHVSRWSVGDGCCVERKRESGWAVVRLVTPTCPLAFSPTMKCHYD